MELSGTTALVTGATRGFGRAITVALHGAGADVVAVARNAEQLARSRSDLGGSVGPRPDTRTRRQAHRRPRIVNRSTTRRVPSDAGRP
jgi:NAD(P)-dependent dehydrogenase (short-subunit alcohol dehydrogenase family)